MRWFLFAGFYYSIFKDYLELYVHGMTSPILSILIDFTHARLVTCTIFPIETLELKEIL